MYIENNNWRKCWYHTAYNLKVGTECLNASSQNESELAHTSEEATNLEVRLPVAVEDGLGLEDAVADGAGGLALRPLLVRLHMQPQHARPLERALAHGACGGLLAVSLKQ